MALQTRRQMLQSASCGFGSLALAGLLAPPQAHAKSAISNDLTPKPTARTARAKRVLFLCMSGGPAHLDTFDYKPQTGKKAHAGSAFQFQKHGQNGIWVSELLPHLAKHADDLCILNGMHADTGNHAQSFLQLHTGERLRKRPSLGSWLTYGLGTDNQNLPGFISLNARKSTVYSSAFLPPVYEGTPLGVNGENMSTATIANIQSSHLPLNLKRQQLDLIQQFNRQHQADRPYDSNLESVIKSMELGFRMQASMPELLDIGQEPKHVLKRYRVGNDAAVGTSRKTDFGRQCLLARRFLEAGVRFVEINHSSWDHHKNYRRDLTACCQATDAPIAALLSDLKSRGLLEDTLVIWGGEFGRPGLNPAKDKDQTGHNARGFTFWLAGGGVKPGYVHGKTDATGSRAVEGKVHFRDLHATILHLMGLQHDKLTFTHAGREHRLTGPEGGKVVQQILL